MKVRLISAFAALGVLFLAIYFYDKIILKCMAAFVCGLGTYELFNAKKLTKHKGLLYASVGFSAVMMFINIYISATATLIVTIVYVMYSLFYLVAKHNEVSIEDICYGLVTTGMATIPLHLMMMIRDGGSPQFGVYYLMVTFGSAWWADTGAYFAGTFLGKHKLAPNISPKKTVEGVIGGLVVGILGNLLIAFLFSFASLTIAPAGYFAQEMHINVMEIVIATPVLCLVGVVGDLVASVIKRQLDIKDFGNIMPGHGGVMDRFDSVTFISPIVYCLYLYMPFLTLG